MTDQLLVFLAGGGFFLGLFVAVLLLSPPRSARAANRALAALVGVVALNVAHPAAYLLFPSVGLLHTPFLIEPLQFLMPPLIAAYFRILISGIAWRQRDWLHGLPFLCIAALALSPLPAQAVRSANPILLAVLLWVLLLVQALPYYRFAFHLLHRYRQALREETSNTTNLDLGWLLWFSISILALFLCYAVALAMMIHGHGDFEVRALLAFALSAFVAASGYRGMLQEETPKLLASRGPALASGGGKEPRLELAERPTKEAMPAAEAERLRERLEAAMETRHPWLDPDLDLSCLAKIVGATRNQLSFVINRLLGKNFYDFVNEYRVKEVLRLMADPARARDKILVLALDAGFNSKPTFNKVMVKLTGKTPSRLRSQTIESHPSR